MAAFVNEEEHKMQNFVPRLGAMRGLNKELVIGIDPVSSM
jgi:hypothetical protein